LKPTYFDEISTANGGGDVFCQCGTTEPSGH